MAVGRLPYALLKPCRNHEVRVDCLCDLDDALLAGFPGHAHSFLRLQPTAAWTLLEHAFYVQRNVNVKRVWTKISSTTKWLQHMKALGSHAKVASQVLCLGEIKTNDLFLFVKPGEAFIHNDMMQHLTLLSVGMIKWRIVLMGHPLKTRVKSWESGYDASVNNDDNRCDFGTLDVRKWFYDVEWMFVLHVPMHKSEHFPHAMLHDQGIHIPSYDPFWEECDSHDWTDAEMALSKACKKLGIAVKQRDKHSRKKKHKTHQNPESDYDDDDDNDWE
jgi:hypothetical protein